MGENNNESHYTMGVDQEGTVKEKEEEKTGEKKDKEIEEYEKEKDLERTIDDNMIAVRTLSKSNMEELVNCYFTVLNTTERPSPPVAISPYASISRMGSNTNTRCPTRSGSGSALDSGYKEHAFGRISATKCDGNAVDVDGVDLEKDTAWRRHSIVLDYAPTPRPASPSPSSPPSTLPNGREEGMCPVEALLGSEKDFGFANGADEICSKLEAIKVKSDSYELRRLNGEEKEDSESETEENGVGKKDDENENEKDSERGKEKGEDMEKEGEKEKEREKGEKMKWNPTALLSTAPIPVSKNSKPYSSASLCTSLFTVLYFPPLHRLPFFSLLSLLSSFISLHFLLIHYSTLLYHPTSISHFFSQTIQCCPIQCIQFLLIVYLNLSSPSLHFTLFSTFIFFSAFALETRSTPKGKQQRNRCF